MGIALAERNATPQEESAILRDLAQALIDDGALNLGQGYALVSKLDMIDRQLADRNIEAAAELFHAFIDQADAEIQGDKLRKQVDKFIKIYDDLPKKLHKRFTRKMKKHIAYWDYQYQHVKGALRSDFKDQRETWKSLLKKFEKKVKIQ